MLYFACGIGFLDSTTTTVMRSMIIGVVPRTEIGRVFSVVEFFKGILSFAGPVIYGKLYEHTLRVVPEAFLYLGISCKVLVFICGIIIYIELSKKAKREKLQKYAHKKDDTFNHKEEETNEMMIDNNRLNASIPVTPPPTYNEITTVPVVQQHHDTSRRNEK